MSLKAIIEQANLWRRITNQEEEQYPPASREEILRWGKYVNSRMEPEALTCDGELSRAQVDARIDELIAAWAELVELDKWDCLHEAEEWWK